MAGQLYHCHSFLTKQDNCTIYKSWIRPTLGYGSVLYSGAPNTHLCRLDDLQSRIECLFSFVFQPLTHQNAAIMGLVCHLLAGEGCGNLTDLLPTILWQSDSPYGLTLRSHRLYSWDLHS